MNAPKTNRLKILCTGGSKGIGYATCRRLASLGHAVILTSRSKDRAERAASTIMRETGSHDVEGLDVRLDSLEDVRRFYGNVRTRARKVDVLINNAGVITNTWQPSVDGHEMQFAVNYLAHFLLTNLFMMDKSIDNPARVVNVSSQVHHRLPIDIEDLDSKTIKYDRIDVYSRSKLAMIYFSEQLAERLNPAETTANSVHPGVIATDLLSDYYNRGPLMRRLRPTKGDDIAEGAVPLSYLATSSEISGVTGRFFNRTSIAQPRYPNSDDSIGSKLWERSSELCEIAAF